MGNRDTENANTDSATSGDTTRIEEPHDTAQHTTHTHNRDNDGDQIRPTTMEREAVPFESHAAKRVGSRSADSRPSIHSSAQRPLPLPVLDLMRRGVPVAASTVRDGSREVRLDRFLRRRKIRPRATEGQRRQRLETAQRGESRGSCQAERESSKR